MTPGKQAWNAWDVPYFGGPLPEARPIPGPATHVAAETAPPAAQVTTETAPATVVELAGGGVRAGERILAVLIGMGAIFAGVGITGLLLVAQFVLSFGSSASGSEMLFAWTLGGVVAVLGLALAVMTYRDAGRVFYVKLDGDRLEITYKTFKTPFVVQRDLVRAVAIDATPSRLFTNNKRFPIAGAVPPGAFADALDNIPAGPWDDLDPDRRTKCFPSLGVILEDATASRTPPGAYVHDRPDRDGWASTGRAERAPEPPREAYLWSAHGSSLPFLRIGPGDVPNVALVFHEPQRAPRAPWWFDLSPVHGRFHFFRGGRRVRGALLRVGDVSAAERAFADRGLLRQITADDVVEEGLLVPKPLVGLRAVAYGVFVIGSLLADLIFRHFR